MNIAPNRRALITGASTGIGRSTALAFAKAGFDVALVSRSADKLQTLVDEIGAIATVKALSFPMDLSVIDQV